MKFLARLMFIAVLLLGGGCSKTSNAHRSGSLVSFECRYSTALIEAKDNRYAVISYYALKEENGEFKGVANRASRDAPESYSVEFTASEDAMSDLQELISEIEITKLKGINNDSGINTSDYGFELHIAYDDGETLDCRDNQQNWLTELQMMAIRKWFEKTAGI